VRLPCVRNALDDWILSTHRRKRGSIRCGVIEGCVVSAKVLPVSKYATRFVALEALLRATLGSLNNNLATAYRGNVDGRLRQTVDDRFAAAVASTRALLDALSTSVMGGEIKGVDLAVLKQPSITAVENALNALNVGQAELARLLNARIDTLRFRLYENLAMTAVLVGLSVLIAIMIHRHIVRPLQRLENVAKRRRRDEGL